MQLVLRIAFGCQAVNQHDTALGFQHADHLSERPGGLLHMMERVLAGDQVEAGGRVGKLVGVATIEKGVANAKLALEFARLTQHLRRQVYAARKPHAGRERQDKFPRTAGYVERHVGGLRLREFHLLSEDFGGIAHGKLGKRLNRFGKLLSDCILMSL